MNTSASPEQGTIDRILARARLGLSLPQTAAGRRRIGRAIHKRVSPHSLRHADIVVGSTAWRSLPSSPTIAWRPADLRSRTVYVEHVSPLPSSALVERRTSHRSSALAVRAIRETFGETADVAWSYPASLDAWNLADLLHSITGQMPHGWGRAEALSLMLAVDPYGAGSVLLSRCFGRAKSVIVLTDAIRVEPQMLGSLHLADVVLSHSKHEDQLKHEHLRNRTYFDDDKSLLAAVSRAGADLLPVQSDPLVAFTEGAVVDETVFERLSEADVIIRVDGDWSLPVIDVAPRTFRALLDANVERLEIVSARLSLILMNRTFVEHSDHRRFLHAVLSDGMRVEVA